MFAIAPKLRLVLRWLTYGVASFAVSGALLLIALPFLIEDRAVHDGLVRSLSAWSGGPVTISGSLRVVSFTSLSIEAADVVFASTPRLDPISKLKAKTVTAGLRIASLLRGRIEFKRIEAASPQLFFRRGWPEPKVPSLGFESARMAVAFADLSRFERLELRQASFFISDGALRPYRRIDMERVKLDKPRPHDAINAASNRQGHDTGLVTLLLQDKGFEAYFRGHLRHAEAMGALRLTLPAGHPASQRVVAAIAPWEQGRGMRLEGELNWAPARASLEGATISFDDHSAKGSLALALRRGRALLEGTLAYDKLDTSQSEAWKGGGSQTVFEPLRVLAAALTNDKRTLDLDMRISAEQFLTGSGEAGPLAVALASGPGRYNIDVAELALFGGKITGRLDYNPSLRAGLSLDASGSKLNAHALMDALGWPSSVEGAVNLHLALAIPFEPSASNSASKPVKGNFSVAFPGGGALDEDLSRRVGAAFDQNAYWGLGSNQIGFTSASINGTAEAGAIAFRLDAENASSHVSGTVRLGLPTNSIDGELTIGRAPDADGPAVQGSPADATAPLKIMLSGTPSALNFAPQNNPHLSN